MSDTGISYRLIREKWKRAVVLLAMMAVVTAVVGCSAGEEDPLAFEDPPVAPIYNEALAELEGRNYRSAARKFEEVDRMHPYSEWAKKAMLLASYAYYEGGAYDDSVSAARRYLALHPGSEDAAYAQFLVAQSYYEQIPDISRDQLATQRALDAYSDVINKFPESKYADQSRVRILQARDQLAGKEMEVGRYYLRQQNYIGAVNRFKEVVSKYQTTNHIEEALMRLTEAYMAMGITSEAQTAAAILGHNYPSSQWYADAYSLLKSGGLEPREDSGSWLTRVWKTVRG